MKQDFFGFIVFVDDDGGATDFRSGARCRRHRNDGGDGIGFCAFPIIANIFEIPKSAFLPGHEGDGFAGVHGAAATESNYPVVAAFVESP